MEPLEIAKSEIEGNRAPVVFSFISTTPHKMTGLSSYTDSFVSAYARTETERKILLLTNSAPEIFDLLPHSENVQIVPIFRRGRLPFKIYVFIAHLVASWMARRLKAKEYVSTTPQGAILPLVRQSIVIHDMYDVDPNFRSRFHVAYTKICLSLYALVSKHIICVSDATFKDAAIALRGSGAKMQIIKEASKYPPIPEEEALSQVRNGRILFVANIESTKNAQCLLNAIRLAEQKNIDLHFNWIGRDPSDIVAKWLEQNGPLRNFHMLGTVDDATLASHYKQSSALVVTSFREGFCLPILEANAYGTPAIVSDIPILREVAGEAGTFFDPVNPEDCLTKMCELLLADQDYVAWKRRLALENARKYSWDDSSRQLKKLFCKRAAS